MGTAAVAYIALLASRLPWILRGAEPAAAGAGYSSRFDINNPLIYFYYPTLKKPQTFNM